MPWKIPAKKMAKSCRNAVKPSAERVKSEPRRQLEVQTVLSARVWRRGERRKRRSPPCQTPAPPSTLQQTSSRLLLPITGFRLSCLEGLITLKPFHPAQSSTIQHVLEFCWIKSADRQCYLKRARRPRMGAWPSNSSRPTALFTRNATASARNSSEKTLGSFKGLSRLSPSHGFRNSPRPTCR